MTTDNSGRVTGLSLSDNGLSGKIPTVLADLTGLQTLDLSANELGGEVPSELGKLANLQTLNLSSNTLSDDVPSELGELANLQTLDISENHLTGHVSQSLTKIVGIKEFDFSGDNSTLCALARPAFIAWIEKIRGSSLKSDEPCDQEETDRVALTALYNAANGAKWATSTNWLSDDKQLDEWYGVTVVAQGVTEVDLRGNKLSGTIPPGLGGLADL